MGSCNERWSAWQSSVTLSSHFFLGLPLGRIPPVWPRSITCGYLLESIWATRPKYDRRLDLLTRLLLRCDLTKQRSSRTILCISVVYRTLLRAACEYSSQQHIYTPYPRVEAKNSYMHDLKNGVWKSREHWLYAGYTNATDLHRIYEVTTKQTSYFSHSLQMM